MGAPHPLGRFRRGGQRGWNSRPPHATRPRALPCEIGMKARVTVTLKSGVLDPQGKAIEGALRSLGVEGVASVRQGKVFDVELDTADKGKAESALKNACERLLANTGWRSEARDGITYFRCASRICAAGSVVSYKRQPHRPALTLAEFEAHHRGLNEHNKARS